MSTERTALPPQKIEAWRRPRAVLAVSAWELACGLLVATPAHAWAKGIWGAHPDGDAVLFRTGGFQLISWLDEPGSALPTVVNTSFVWLLVFAIAGEIVFGALVTSLATARGEDDGRGPPLSSALRSGAAAFVPLVATSALVTVAEGFFLGLGLLAATGVGHVLSASLGDARAFTAQVVALGLFVAVMLVVGVLGDLAKVAIARDVATDDQPTKASARIKAGLRTARDAASRALGRATGAWAVRAALGVLLVYVGSRAGDAASGRGGAVLWGLFAFHQAIVVGRVALRASWLAYALRALGPRP